MHKPPHLPMRDGAAPVGSHNKLPLYATDDWAIPSEHGVMPAKYNETHNPDNPCSRYGTQPSDSFHQRPCCAQPTASLQYVELSPATQQEK